MPAPSDQPQPSKSIGEVSLASIADLPSVAPSAEAQEAYSEEIRALKQSEVDHSNEDLENKRTDRKQRKYYGPLLFKVIATWLALVAYIVFAQGFGEAPLTGKMFRLSDTVMVAFLTNSTATVVGIFLVVVNYLFPKR